jgi:hypothetical protein
MKNIFIFLFLSGIINLIFPQPYFQKITTGLIVNNNSWSEGCAWADYDDDGYMDVVVTTFNDYCWPCYFPLQLYLNNGNGTFTRVTTGPIPNEITAGFGCSWGDYDNDGKIDLFVCTGFGLNNLLFHNNGNGNFTKITSGIIVNDGGFSVSSSWLDYDKDGWLDLFVCNQQNDFLYHNNGNGTFTKVVSGSIVNDGLSGRSCASGDYDNDGRQDIIITSWAGPVRLYHNNGNGTFSTTSGIIPNFNAYYDAVSFGDYDNDGWLDLFICAINSGNNILLHNNGGSFSQAFYAPSFDNGPQSFGATWTDFDNDGWLDLFVTNNGNHNFLYRNNTGIGFTKITNEIITVELVHGIGCSTSDINMDGKMDFFVANNGTSSLPANNLLYQNITQNSNNYIGIKLKGCILNRSAIGARVTVKAGGRVFIREVSGGGGYHSQDMTFQHFGIGNAALIDSIIVKWTTGNISRLANIQPNQYITIDECLIGIISYSSEIPVTYSLSQNYPNPFNPTTRIKFGLPKSSGVSLKIFDINGKEISDLINSELNAGYYEYEYDASNLSSGVYLYQLNTDDFKEVKKMVYVK